MTDDIFLLIQDTYFLFCIHTGIIPELNFSLTTDDTLRNFPPTDDITLSIIARRCTDSWCKEAELSVVTRLKASPCHAMTP